MKIKEAAENYLETIYILQNRIGLVRSIDICNEMGYSKPTISVVMKDFRNDGYITMSEEGFISLTEKGKSIAERIYERHVVIAQALMTLGVAEQTAYTDSCKIEHDISEESFQSIKRWLSACEKRRGRADSTPET